MTTDIYRDSVDSAIANLFTRTSSNPPFVSMGEFETNYFVSMLEAKS